MTAANPFAPATQAAPAAPATQAAPAAPLVLRTMRRYKAIMKAEDNPLTEGFITAYLGNFGFTNIILSGEDDAIEAEGTWSGTDKTPVPVDPRLTVTAL